MTDLKKASAKTALMDTLTNLLYKKTFQKISVNELCETSHVSRSSFYANFEDKYHLLASLLEATAEQIDALIESASPDQLLLFILDQIQKDGRLFYNAFHSELDKGTMMVLYHFFERHLSEILKQKTSQGIDFPKPLSITCSFYIGGLVTATLEWIRSGYKLPKEEIADCLSRLMTDVF